jgi:mRNA-degrading endonuclease RelE of RelBE toxin-antitoxin system
MWDVVYSNRAGKAAKKLPKKVKVLLDALALQIEKEGPYRQDWSNYGPLKKGSGIPDDSYHCHLKKGHPTYVACWQIEKALKRVEVFYVGTHEGAPY